MTVKQLDERLEAFAADIEKRLLMKLAEMISGGRVTTRIEVYHAKFTDRSKLPPIPSGVTVHEGPIEGYKYFIGAYIGEGLGGECDNSAFSVVEFSGSILSKVRQVAWYSKNTVDPIEFAGILDAVGRNYNDAVVAPEVNRYDSTIWAIRSKHGYPNLYRWKTVDSKTAVSNKLGWFTNSSTKPRLHHWFRSLMKSNRIEINDTQTRDDFKRWYSNAATSIEGGLKDDHMQALLIASYVAAEN